MCFFTLLLCNFYKRRKRSIKLKHIGGIGGSVVSLNNVTSVGNHDENENETAGEGNHHGNEVGGGDLRYALTGGVNLKIKVGFWLNFIFNMYDFMLFCIIFRIKNNVLNDSVKPKWCRH